MDALLLIDLQYDFMPGGPLAVADGDAVLPVANRLMERFDIVVATQDWHPKDHSSFAANHPGKRPGEIIDLNGVSQILWPIHCVQNTHGAALHASIDPRRITSIVQKGTDPTIDSYSGFFDNARQKSTGLEDVLRGMKIGRLFVMGLASDYCVKFTVLDGLSLGFAVRVVLDGCRGVEISAGDSAAAIEAMRTHGAIITSCDEELARG